MKEEWLKVKLGDLCENIFSGGTPKTQNESYWNGELNWLSSGETRNRYILDTEKTITQKGVDNSSTRFAKKYSVIMATAGQGFTRGQTSFLLIDSYINQSLISLETKKNKLEPKFLFYNLNNRYRELRELSDANSSRGSITTKFLKQLPIKIPKSLETQKKIAKMLSNYDDLIENNNKRIEILEKQAKLIYEEWFVKFKFPTKEKIEFVDSELGKIPKGWEVGKLKELYSLLPGYAYKSKDFKEEGNYGIIKIKNLDNQFVDIQNVNNLDIEKSKFEIFSGNLLIAMTGAQIGKIGIMPESKKRFFLNQRVGKFIPNKEYFTNNCFIYLLSKSHKFQEYVKGISLSSSAQPNISGDQIEGFNLIIPEENILKEFDNKLNPLFNELINLQNKNQNLRKTRDLLLPKLISGQIDTKDLNIKIDED